MRALIALNEGIASPNELAKRLDESLGVVSYHVKQLLELGCIELVKTEPRRGAVEHYYRATTRAIFDKGWDRLPQEARTSVSSGVLSEIWRDVGRSLTDGSFDREVDRHLSRTTLVLDQKAWEALNARLETLVEWALEQQVKAAARIAKGEPAVVSKLAMMHFPMPQDEAATAAPRKTTSTKAARSARPSTKPARRRKASRT